MLICECNSNECSAHLNVSYEEYEENTRCEVDEHGDLTAVFHTAHPDHGIVPVPGYSEVLDTHPLEGHDDVWLTTVKFFKNKPEGEDGIQVE